MPTPRHALACILVAAVALAAALAAPADIVRSAPPPGETTPSPGGTPPGIEEAAPGAPPLASPSAVLMDAASGEILLAKNPHERRNPASVTKLMTLAVLYDAVTAGQVHWNDPVQASAHAASMGGSQVFLSPGETFSLQDMTAAVAVASANDAAMAVAEHVAGSEAAFVQRMQALAEKVGMKDSSFRNPHGLDADGHVMSSYDIALVSRYLVVSHPQVLTLTSTWMRPFRAPPREFILVNTNKLLKRYTGVDGLKTGWTSQAGYSVSITATRGATRLIAVVLGAPTAKERWSDITSMLEWGFANFETVALAKPGATIRRVGVDVGRERTVDAIVTGPVAVTVRKGQRGQVTQRAELPERVTAPVTLGQRLGSLKVELAGKVVLDAPIVAAAPVARADWGTLFLRFFQAAWPW